MGRFYELDFEMDEAESGTLSWMVTAPAFPEITTFGDTKQAAFDEGMKAIEEAIAARISNGEEIPPPKSHDSDLKFSVEIPLMVYLKCGLYMICQSKKVSRAELSRRLGWHREQVDRLFRIEHKSQLDQIEAAFKAIGVSINIGLPIPVAA